MYLTCKVCKQEFQPGNGNPKAKYCSDKCRGKYYNNRIKKNNLSRTLELSSGETGQICEFRVASDLIIKGYKVYTPFDTTAKIDLLAYNGSKYIKVQVKAGGYGRNMEKLPVKVKNNNHDVLAIVYNLHEIVYQPDIPTIR